MGFWDYKGLADPNNKLPSMNYRGAFLPEDNYSRRPAVQVAPPMQFKNPFDQATMSTAATIPQSLSESVVSNPFTAPPAAPKSEIKSSNMVARAPRKGGGWVMSSGGTTTSDPDVGIAVRDAQERQASLNAAGVGTTQTLGQRLGGIRGGGFGALTNAMMQSRVARDDFGRMNKDRAFNLAETNAFADRELKAEELRADQEKAAGELDFKKGYLDVLKRQAETGEKALSFNERLEIARAKNPGKDYDSEILKGIITANAADPKALSDALTNFRNAQQGKVFVPGEKSKGFGGFLGLGSPATEDQWADPNEVVKKRKSANGQMEGLTRDGRVVPL